MAAISAFTAFVS
jgi:hypothetical protein